MVSIYNGKYLLNLEQATELISRATNQPRKYAGTYVSQAGECGKLRIYDRFGMPMDWHRDVYQVDDIDGVVSIKFRQHYLVDMGELMDAMGLHSNMQDRVINLHNEHKAAQAKPEQTPAPAQSTAQHDTTDTRGRKGLPTPDIAVLFDGAPFTKNEWNKRINERKWLQTALLAKGEQGGAPAMWCPVKIGRLVWGKYTAEQSRLKRVFQNPALAPWRDEWDQFIAQFSNDD